MDAKQHLSGNIRSIHYDLVKQELLIQFCYSGAYRYRKVPPEVYEELKKSAAPEVFVERSIRPRFSAVKMITV